MGVQVVATGEVLDVFVSGMDRIWGLRSRLEIPMSRVDGARVAPAAEAKAELSIRTGGLGVPGLALVGHFRGRTVKKQWWRVYRAEAVLIVELSADSQFDRLVLQVDEPAAVAAAIEAARSGRDRTV